MQQPEASRPAGAVFNWDDVDMDAGAHAAAAEAPRTQLLAVQDNGPMAEGADDAPLPRAADGGVILPSGKVVHPSVTVHMSSDADAGGSTSAVDQRRVLYMGEHGPVYAGEGQQPFFGLARDTGYPVTGAPAWARPADGSPLSYTFDGAGEPFWRKSDGTLISVPAPYALPQLADLQAAALLSGAADAVGGLPQGLVNGASDLLHGRVTVDSLLIGLYENSPVGVLAAMADDNYSSAGSRLVGTGIGLTAGAAFKYGVMPAGARAFGELKGFVNGLAPDVSGDPFLGDLAGAIAAGDAITAPVTISVRTAAQVNEAMEAAGMQPAWLRNTEVVTRVDPAGTRYQMVVEADQGEALLRGRLRFGRWASSDAVPSQAYARNDLAILEEFKSDVSRVVTVEATAPQAVNSGWAGQLGNYSGGASQIEFLGTRNLRLIGEPVILPLK